MHIKTLKTRELCADNGGCGECQTSCQSACKTSCGVANQPCEQRVADGNGLQAVTTVTAITNGNIAEDAA